MPLRARGRRLGALTLLMTAGSRRNYDPEDLEFAKVLAGRAALALDNAGLFSELETIEAQLTAVLSTLAEAVTVQRTEGALIYANEAAARMLGYASAQELLSTPVDQIVSAFDSTNEDGSPLRIEDLPGRQLLGGNRDPKPLVVRAVDKRSGRVDWRVTKASGVYDSAGDLTLVVNVIEDISEVKRAEIAQRMLARAGELLSSSLDYERTLQQVAELAVPELADWCAVSLPDDQGFVRAVAVAHVDPDKVAFARRLAERYPTPADAPSGTPQILRDGQPQLTNDVSDELLAAVAQDEQHLELLREVGMRAGLAVPMPAGGRDRRRADARSAPSPAGASATRTSRSPRSSRGAPGRRSRTRACTASARTSRARCRRACCPRRLPQMPGWTAATLYRPGGRRELGRRGLLRRLRGARRRLACDRRRRRRPRRARRPRSPASRVTRCGPPRRCSTTRSMRCGTLNEELLASDEMALCSVAAVLLDEDEAGAATAQIVSAGHPLPLLVRAGTVRRDRRVLPDARRVCGRRVVAHVGRRSSPATCSCSSPTACSTPSETASASARRASPARSPVRPTRRMRWRGSTPR